MRNKGFTLVEILIVVIILGILAAIVIPQFTEASNDARESALASDLQTARSQLELYKVQHLDTYPAAATFVHQLTVKTDLDGTDGTTFGPYLQSFPTNPFNDDATVTVEAGTTSLGNGLTGWHFDTTTGRFSASDNAAHAAL
jgi:general secretion pathway protein G